MLPKEVGNLFAAVITSTETQIDVKRLQFELAGLNTFHETLINDKLLTARQSKLFEQHVGKFVVPRPEGRDFGITAPRQGPPQVRVQITAPAKGAPSVGVGIGPPSMECPHCHKIILL